jgi:acyl transferase domain-containing protein
VVVTGTDDEALAEIFAPLADRVAWTRYASARLRPASAEPLPFDQRALPDADSADTDAAAGFYQRLRGMGLGCGPAYQGITALAIGDRVATGLLAMPLSLAGEIEGAGWHPAVLESALQLLVAALPDDLDILHLTSGADRVWFAAAGASRAAAALRRGEALRVSARVEPDGNAWLGDLRLTDAQGTVLLGVSALRLVPLADGIELLTAAARRQLGEGDAGSAPSVRQALAAATPGPERRGLLEDHLRGALGAVLKLAPARIEMTSSLGTYGTDSVMTLKLRNRLEESLGLTLSASVIWNHPTLGALTEYLADQLGIALDAVVVADDEPPPPIIITIDPDEPVETQLNRELALVDALLEDA